MLLILLIRKRRKYKQREKQCLSQMGAADKLSMGNPYKAAGDPRVQEAAECAMKVATLNRLILGVAVLDVVLAIVIAFLIHGMIAMFEGNMSVIGGVAQYIRNARVYLEDDKVHAIEKLVDETGYIDKDIYEWLVKNLLPDVRDGVYSEEEIEYILSLTPEQLVQKVEEVNNNYSKFKESIQEDSKKWKWNSIADQQRISITGTGIGGMAPGAGGTGYGGHATGEYAKVLDDGSWYVFHQYAGSLTAAQYGGPWNAAVWGPSSNNTHPFTKDGCAVYAMAMAVSNSVGRVVTPEEILTTAGVTKGMADGKMWYNTSTSGCFNGRSVNRANFVSTICSAYGLQYSSVNSQAEADEVLNKGGYIWGRWGSANFQWYYGSAGHFMAVRSTAYRVLTSSDWSHNALNNVADFSTWWGHHDGAMFGIWNPNPTSSSGGLGTLGSWTSVMKDEEVYEALRAAGFSDSDAVRVSTVYAYIAPEYGSQAALALAACSLCEGRPGQFEGLLGYMTGKNSTSGLNKSYAGLRNMYLAVQNGTATQQQIEAVNTFTELGGKIISSADQAVRWQAACDALEQFCGSSMGQGIGFIQFSGGRRTPRLQAYAQATDFSDGGRWQSEMNACLAEVAGNSGYKSGFVRAQAASTPKEAVDIMFTTYISGGSTKGIGKREEKMNSIALALGGTKK